MRKAIDDVTEFHEVMNQPVLAQPRVPSDERVHLRASLVDEEFEEVFEALGFKREDDGTCSYDRARVNIVELADGLADLAYVIVGTALEFGIPLDRVWDEVHRSNMAKVWPDGEVRHHPNGKVMKPSTWTPPDVAGVLETTCTCMLRWYPNRCTEHPEKNQ